MSEDLMCCRGEGMWLMCVASTQVCDICSISRDPSGKRHWTNANPSLTQRPRAGLLPRQWAAKSPPATGALEVPCGPRWYLGTEALVGEMQLPQGLTWRMLWGRWGLSWCSAVSSLLTEGILGWTPPEDLPWWFLVCRAVLCSSVSQPSWKRIPRGGQAVGSSGRWAVLCAAQSLLFEG